jgi:hypothetical protein
MEKGASATGPTENFGGSTRVKDEAVRRLLRIPIRLRVGERPAGADSVLAEVVMSSFGTGDRGCRTERGRVDFTGLYAAAKSLKVGAALVRTKWGVEGLKFSVPS